MFMHFQQGSTYSLHGGTGSRDCSVIKFQSTISLKGQIAFLTYLYHLYLTYVACNELFLLSSYIEGKCKGFEVKLNA